MAKNVTEAATVVQVSEEELAASLLEFADPSFIDPNGRLPRIQAVRGEDPKQFGYFIPLGEMAKAGWADFDETQLIGYTFQNGAVEKGLLLQSPRMLVCPKTPLLAIDKEQGKELQTTVILGEYRLYKGQENIGNMQMFQIILLDANNKPLHQIPLMYKAKGTNQASFSTQWQAFCSEMNTVLSLVNKQHNQNQEKNFSPKPKNNTFNSLLVFCPKLAREIVGDKQKSPALRVTDYEHPTLENWTKYFVGINKEVKEFAWQSLTPLEPMQIPGLPVSSPAVADLPEAVTVAALPASSSQNGIPF